MEVPMKQLLIGTIVNTHGLRGEVKIKPKTHFINERFVKGKKVILQDQNLELEILNSRPQKDMLLITFQNYEDINMVEAWKGLNLYVDEATLPTLKDNEIYYHELYDCQVFDEHQELLGNVVEVIETGANAVLRVQQGNNSFLLPYVNAFIQEVDKNKKTIIIKRMEGLL